jgi:hypothetical protein
MTLDKYPKNKGENLMAISEIVTGNDSVAITGTASSGERTVGIKGIGDSVGVRGEGKDWHGVEGISNSTIGGHGVFGTNTAGGTGVVGTSTKWVGVYGETAGLENGPAGVWGEHKGAGIGVKAVTSTGVGLVAVSIGDGKAGVFQGNVEITGSLTVQGTNIGGLAGRIQAIEGLAGRVQAVEGLVGRVQTLEQKVAALESQVNTAVSNLTGRITQAELAIVDLKFRVQQLGG